MLDQPITNPLDPGTVEIVRDGLLIVYDPDRILARLPSTVAALPVPPRPAGGDLGSGQANPSSLPGAVDGREHRS